MISGPGLGEAGELPDPPAGALRLEVPERAVDGVARGARRQQRLQRGAVEARRAGPRSGRRRCRASRRSGHRARIRRGPRRRPSSTVDGQHPRLGARAAADGEDPRQREGLGRDGRPRRARHRASASTRRRRRPGGTDRRWAGPCAPRSRRGRRAPRPPSRPAVLIETPMTRDVRVHDPRHRRATGRAAPRAIGSA